MLNTSANIKEPGLNVLPPGVERYVVNGGGLTGIQILPDDEIEIVNNEGNQISKFVGNTIISRIVTFLFRVNIYITASATSSGSMRAPLSFAF